jgi:hypothetical protein
VQDLREVWAAVAAVWDQLQVGRHAWHAYMLVALALALHPLVLSCIHSDRGGEGGGKGANIHTYI